MTETSKVKHFRLYPYDTQYDLEGNKLILVPYDSLHLEVFRVKKRDFGIVIT